MFAIDIINNGALYGIKAMPQKDSTSDHESTFSMGRNVFVNTYSAEPTNLKKKWIGGNRDASQITTNNRNKQIGTGSVNASGNLMSYTTFKDINTVNNALTRVRAGGAVAPPKKAFSPSNTYVPVPSFQATGAKSLYGMKMPYLYH